MSNIKLLINFFYKTDNFILKTGISTIMTIKLDVKDRKILYQLDIDSRQPNSEIAKKVGLSKQVVGFRIKRLVKENIISFFYTIIDISKLGFTAHKSFMRLQNVDREKELQIISYLKNNPNIVWVASCDGKYDLAFSTWAKNMEQLDKALREIDGFFRDYISEREIASIIRGEYFVRDYLIDKKEPSPFRRAFFGAVPSPVDMDDIDWQILLELGKDSRATSVELSKLVDMSADAVSNRIRRMEKSGIIRNYNIVPNESAYPFLHYKVLVGLRNISEMRENSLIEYCRTNPNIIYIAKTLGPWEFEIDIEAKNAEQFREIMMELKTMFKDIIKDYSALNIYQVHKYNFCPSIPKELASRISRRKL